MKQFCRKWPVCKGWLYSSYFCYYCLWSYAHLSVQSNGSYFFKGHCQVLLKNSAMLHISQPYVGAVCWGRNCLTPAKISGSFLIGKGGWWFGLHCPLSSYFSTMLRQEFPRRRIFFLQDPQPEHLVSALSLATNLFHDLPQGMMPFSASISFPSFSMCMLWSLHGLIFQRNLKLFHFSKAIIFRVCESLAPAIQFVTQRSPEETNALSTVGGSVLGFALLWMSLLLQFDPKSTAVEEFYITSAQISPKCLQIAFQ